MKRVAKIYRDLGDADQRRRIMQKLDAAGEGPTIFTARMIEIANTCCGFGGEVFPWRGGGGVLEMPAREYEAVMIVRSVMNAPRPQGG